MLYLVPTPIGNLEDMTFRAIAVLKKVEFILAEDTRTSGKLLKHYGIDTPMKAYHAHNEHAKTSEVIKILQEGKDIALISDAGTPAISDPGFLLVRSCHENKIEITCLPGANALIPALAMSGIPCDKFYFEGFLPHKKGRQTRWKYLAGLDCTIGLYESPHRIGKLLSEAKLFLEDNRPICIIKEISKLYETIHRGTILEMSGLFDDKKAKGEFVVIIGLATKGS